MATRIKERLRTLMLQAWEFVRRCKMSMAEAMRLAWMNAKLRAAMGKRVVRFTFKKKDGSTRQAVGTLQPSYYEQPKGTGKISASAQTFFDTEKQAWRSFIKSSLLAVEW